MQKAMIPGRSRASSRMPLLRLFSILLIFSLLVVPAGAFAAPEEAKDNAPAPLTNKVILFASDGMRPDLMEKYAAKGAMPTYAALMAAGVRGDNGMMPAFPPNTGVGWYTMATGTYPSEHGSTNNTFFRAGDAFANRTSFSGAGVLQADTIANAAERAGKKVAQIDWVAGIAANIDGPTVDFTTFFSNRGVLVGAADPVEQAGSAFFGVTYQDAAALVPAAGWASVPIGDPASPPQETTWAIPSTFAAQNPNRTYNVYFYDSVTGGGVNYDHAIVSPVGKTGAAPSVDLKVGDFLPIKLMGANGLIGPRANQTVGHYVKLISLAPDASQFKLYDTSLARAIAKCGTVCNSLPAGGAGEDRLEKYIADNLLPWAAGDFAPLEAGVVDEDTYVEQGRDLERAYSLQVINYILGTLQPNTDLAMIGYPFTDEVQHQFLALVSPTDANGAPNPCYDVIPKFDDVQCTGTGTAGRVATREGYIESAYADADEKLGIARALMGGNPTTFVGSDHGFAPQWYAVNAIKILNSASVGGISLHASSATSVSNCSGVAVTLTAAPANAYVSGDLAKACWAGGTIQIYVSLTLPAGITNAMVRTAARNAFLALNTGGVTPVSQVLDKEQLRNVDGSDSLHPNRSGDLAVILRPPYQSDAATPNQVIALSHFFGQHGYEPNLVDLANNINMHATFIASGPGIRKQAPVAGVRQIDLAPTISFLMGIPGPQNARGRIMYNLTPKPGQYKEITILNISDFHAQLIPVAEASDTLGPTFGISGAAFLKPWFDWYRAEAPGGSITVAGGDSFGGATPPISNFFGDKPTPPIMNMMGFNAEAVGNHQFDRGEQYLRNELIPLADFPILSANVVDANGKTPAEWSPSAIYSFDGVKLGLIGFTTEDTPDLIFPGNLGPFHLESAVATVNAEAARLRARNNNKIAIVALGHEGANAGTLTNPAGPLIDIADSLTNVDAVIGDHNNIQVLTTRPNGILVTENLGRGVRFTRIRLVVDSSTKQVIYKTADFHRPWNIGVTPDPAIQVEIDSLNAQLGPILGTVVGNSTKAIPRTDQCGNANGRTCESLVGNVTADAMRTKYSSIGVQFAITNSGGLRTPLTCPTSDVAGDFCAAYTPPPFPITRGQVLSVLPFGNIVVTLDVNGAELKTMLENGVSFVPAENGRFPQVSGLCFTYDIAAPVGSRVTGAVLANPDGTCSAATVDLTAASTYKIAENDFTVSGGDGYPNFFSRATSQEIMAQVLEDYIVASPSSTVAPFVLAAPNGRINCTDSNGATAPNCPVLTPSP